MSQKYFKKISFFIFNKHFLYFVIGLAVLSFILITQGALFPTSIARAGLSHNVAGYAWSDNIGWISFNCTNTNSCATSDYGVNIAQNDKFSGYAWSDNIGWISFNENELNGCPSSPCRAKLNRGTGAVTGWAKALSADGNGWDGWINLSGSWQNGVLLNLSTNQFQGYAWGADVVGWIDFSMVTGNQICATSYGNVCNSPANACGATNQSTIQCDGSCGAQFAPPDSSCALPAPTITTNSPRFNRGSSCNITWSTENATSCTLTGPGISASGISGTITTPSLQTTTAYILTCFNGSVVSASREIICRLNPEYEEF